MFKPSYLLTSAIVIFNYSLCHAMPMDDEVREARKLHAQKLLHIHIDPYANIAPEMKRRMADGDKTIKFVGTGDDMVLQCFGVDMHGITPFYDPNQGASDPDNNNNNSNKN